MWRSLCSDGWDLLEAGMVCRHLGYHTAVAAFVLPFFNDSYEIIWRENFQCYGNEMSLSECRHIPIQTYDCSGAAGVACDVDAENSVQDMRLVDGYWNSSGRVEVLIGEMWRSVCSDGWDLQEAGMVCRHLGYHTTVAVFVLPFSHDSYEIIWMENFQCNGSEMSLSECRQIPIQKYYCSRAAGVVCDVDAENSVQDIRLVDGYWNSSGRVEVLIGEMWRSVCSDGWDLQEAGMVCRHLGYHTTVDVLVLPFFHDSYEIIWMEKFQCNGSEMSLSECRHIPIQTYHCSRAAGVVCDGKNKLSFYKDVRIAEGYSTSSGRIEVMIDGRWGGVCTDGWNLADARVVCRQLGYQTTIAISVSDDEYGSVWVNDVHCRGNETSLSECKQAQIWQHECSSRYSAGVVCGGKKTLRV
ncbi:hypothetical protein HOLleu_21547 [Holothuria leucospilota]|uniref:SRCR domain-containing protein n=1 Tax=Holothuria leucospilota TaxID=206669 RepID=A0A9Q1BXL7_HOLLE|nr:hypothetical protein HOLleu_21547 [Holothuria leucospilota]